MTKFIQELVNGLTRGACTPWSRWAIRWSTAILKLLNFAHGDLYMVGALSVLRDPVVRRTDGALGAGADRAAGHVPLAGGGVGALGVAIERFAYRPLRDAPRIAPLITALGVSFLLENTVLLLFGASFATTTPSAFIPFSTGIHIGGVKSDRPDPGDRARAWRRCSASSCSSPARSWGGRCARWPPPRGGRDAWHQRRLHSSPRSSRLRAGRRCRRDGRAGVQPDLHLMGFIIGLKAFTAAVVGGIGSIPGAMLGGFLIGIADRSSPATSPRLTRT